MDSESPLMASSQTYRGEDGIRPQFYSLEIGGNAAKLRTRDSRQVDQLDIPEHNYRNKWITSWYTKI